MTFGKPQAVAPQPAQAGGYSLLVAAGFSTSETIPSGEPEQDTSEPWAGGIEWAPERVSGSGVDAVDCLGSTPDGLSGDPGNPQTNEAFPVLLDAIDRCSTFGFQARDRTGRARRALEATQSFLLAHELQYGAVAQAESIDNPFLTAGTQVGGTLSPVNAMAAMEQVVGREYAGRRAMFYVAPALLTELAAAFVVYQSGQKWLSPMGNVVAADGGFGEEGGNYFIYATLVPRIFLGNVLITPSTDREATDRSVNTVTYTAQRLALVAFDSGADDDNDLIFKAETNVTAATIGS